MKTILITGITGFIGSHLAPLLEKENKVYGLARNVTGRYLLGKNTSFVFGDLNDPLSMKKIIKLIKPHIVIHLGGVTAVSYSYEHPQEVLETNFIATVNLAELCLRENPNIEHFIYASSSETYGNQTKFPITEKAILKPNSPYSASKIASEKYLNYMMDAYEFPVTIMRPFNTYGRINSAHFLIERTITQMLKNQKAIHLGDPTPYRDFMYLDDHLNAYLSVINNKKAISKTFNFCTGDTNSIKDVVDIIRVLIEYKGNIYWNTIPKRPLDIKKLHGSSALANTKLGWNHKYSLEDGLSKTIDKWRIKYATT